MLLVSLLDWLDSRSTNDSQQLGGSGAGGDRCASKGQKISDGVPYLRNRLYPKY